MGKVEVVAIMAAIIYAMREKDRYEAEARTGQREEGPDMSDTASDAATLYHQVTLALEETR